MSLARLANSRACTTLNSRAPQRSANVNTSITPMNPAGTCQAEGSTWPIHFRAASPLPSSTSSTNSGSSKGMGTLHSVARTATPLATHSALR